MGRSIKSFIFLLCILAGANTAAQVLSDTWEAAIRHNDSDRLRALSTLPDAVERATREGKTLLMAAASLGDEELVGVMLRRGADVNRTNQRGGSALMYAASRGHLRITDDLLAAGARVNHRAENGWTAIQLAAAKGHVLIIDILSRYQADFNLPDMFGYTPIMRAIVNGKSEAVARLLQTPDIDLLATNHRGEDALGLAMASANCKIVDQILKALHARGFSPPPESESILAGLDC